MFKQLLYTQWKWGAIIVVIGALAGFAIPVASVQSLGTVAGRYEVSQVMSGMQGWGYLYPLLALFLGMAIPLSAWSPDIQGRHVYSLSLPIPRSHYILLRFVAGVVLLVPAFLGVWIGGMAATVSITLPVGLHPYPFSIALRFALATLLIYAVVFGSGTASKRTGWIIVGTTGALVIGQLVIHLLWPSVDLMEAVFTRLVSWPGPFEVLVSAWMLINV